MITQEKPSKAVAILFWLTFLLLCIAIASGNDLASGVMSLVTTIMLIVFSFKFK